MIKDNKNIVEVAKAFTSRYDGLSRQLINEVLIQSCFNNKGKEIASSVPSKSWRALWDTGATTSCISKNVVDELGLIPIGKKRISTPSGQDCRDTFFVNIYLPNKVVIPNIEVVVTDIIGFDVLIGMDIIGLGNFAVSNFNKKTVFTFRIPSLQEYDFTVSPQLTPYINRVNEPSRNAPCPCGSGKKYKLCCGSKK